VSPPLVHTAPDDVARPAHAPTVLIVQAGQPDPAIRQRLGDYPAWFGEVFALEGATSEPVAVFEGEALPYGGRYEGIVLTGSAHSVRDEAPWMAMLGRWALAMAAHTPVLAVCFGHQLVGEALGGRVDTNPAGPEWGTVDVRLNDAGRADPLFTDLPALLRVHALHRDVVLREPEPQRFTRLAGNPNTSLQAFAVGPWLRAVQFHPELTAPRLGAILDGRGWTPTTPVEASDHGARILRNWVRHYVRRAESAG